jgi:hypothetical protein
MTDQQPIQLADIQRLADTGAPDLTTAIEQLIEQGEPYREETPEGAIDLNALRASLAQAAKAWDKKQRQQGAREAWQRYLAQNDDMIAPQVRLADLVVKLYERGPTDGPARQALLVILREAPLVFGLWGGIKRVYKRAEKDMDAEVFGALAARFDVNASERGGDIGRGTFIYLRRRAWRFLKQIGRGVPEIYPQFAVEVLRNYQNSAPFGSLWVANHIFMHEAKSRTGTSFYSAPPKDMVKHRAFGDAWKRAPEPLMLLLETCQGDPPARFAIQGLRKDFPESLRKVTPEWLARLAHRPLESAHEFLIETLEGSPDFHQGKLEKLGLKEAVLALILSPSKKARTYAIEYARGHATDMPTERLCEILASEYDDATKFAATLIKGRKPRDIGVVLLGRLLLFSETKDYAKKSLEGEFDRGEIPEKFLIDMMYSNESDQSEWAQNFLEKKFKPKEMPIAFWIKLLEDPRFPDSWGIDDVALEALSKFKVSELPADWLVKALADDTLGSTVGDWMEKADGLPKGLDLERVKGMVFNPSSRNAAFTILGSTKLVSPGDVGLGWLLALARRADPALHDWAHKYLLQHMRPEHFADGKEDKEAGTTRLFALATGPKEPEAVRQFAHTYLRCHHPKLSKDQAETKSFGIKPLLKQTDYTEKRIWPALSDNRPDVRRFAIDVTRVELRRWDAQTKIYELGESAFKEVRNLCYEALTSAGEPSADPDFSLKPEELDAAQIFTMTESRKRSTRDVAMELIRRHYGRIGGAERLTWLMQSADREVRLFAVRLLWEKHRPRALPKDWRPSRGKIEDAGRFEDVQALRALLRRLLFTVPPGRSMEQGDARARRLPASVAKRHVIEIVRDLGTSDVAFAQLVAPVLGEFTGSMAKGEWQACVQAIIQLRGAHADLKVEGLS